MKILLVTISALLLSNAVNAQGITAGIRTGFDVSTDITNHKENKPQALWQKQIFTRYETKKRLAFEIYANQSNDRQKITPPDLVYFDNFLPPTHEILDIEEKTNKLLLGASIQYDISCSKLKEKCPILKNLKSYVGVTANITHTWSKEYVILKSVADGSFSKDTHKSNYWDDIQVGLNHTTIYSFNKLFLISTASFTVNPWAINNRLYMQNTPNSRLSLMAGIGYKL